MYVDLHIHSCLSPCADDDMTPANICGMASIKGLDAIAVTDHNCARNLPYVKEAADAFHLILLPGMEITTREEVHVLGYFPTVEVAMEAGEFFASHLPPMKNRPAFFGRQLVVDTDDQVVDEEQPTADWRDRLVPDPMRGGDPRPRRRGGAGAHQPGEQRPVDQPGHDAPGTGLSRGGGMAGSASPAGGGERPARFACFRRAPAGKYP